MNRRVFLAGGLGIGFPPSARTKTREPDGEGKEWVYLFATDRRRVRMTVEFFDGYSARGLWFRNTISNQNFCLSGSGDRNKACLTDFSGALAIARYHIQPALSSGESMGMREHVRTVDSDERLSIRPPFTRQIIFQEGVASDIQAFGLEPAALKERSASSTDANLWCLLRQDLFIDSQSAPFAVLHWKHSAAAIRLLDVIPGDQTRILQEPEHTQGNKE